MKAYCFAVFALVVVYAVGPGTAVAQPQAFTFQGSLTDLGVPASGSYLMEFRLFGQLSGGAAIEVISDVPVTVSDGRFTAQLTFTDPSAFDGSERYLETAVRPAIGFPYETLSPRLPITSAPYALRSGAAADADAVGGVGAAGFVQNRTTQQSSASFNIDGNGTLGGTLTAGSVSVGAGGVTMNDHLLRLRGAGDDNHGMRYSSAVDGPEFRAFSGFIWRNGPNGFSERMRLDPSGNLSVGGSINAGTQYNIGGQRFISNAGSLNVFLGVSAGPVNTGQQNTFVGSRSGQTHTSGLRNTYVGDAAGSQTTNSNENTFVGALAGLSARTIGGAVPAQNSFFGAGAGQNTTTGAGNTFLGFVAGNNNTTGSFNTAVGYNATLRSENLFNATAIGAGAEVSTSNTVVLGTADDRLVVPGLGKHRSALYVSGDGEIGISTSSLRYKTNVAPFSGGQSLLSRLQPIAFDWKDDGTRDIGLAAEAVAEVEPLLTVFNDDGEAEGVKYDRLTVVLLNALKEQQAQLEAQQKQLDAQRKLIEELQARVEADQPSTPRR